MNELHEQWCLAGKAVARDAIYFSNSFNSVILRFYLITLELFVIPLPDLASRQLIMLVGLELQQRDPQILSYHIGARIL